MRRLLTAILLLTAFVTAEAAMPPRRDITLADGWTVRPIANTNRNAKAESVTLPHTWNAEYPEGSHYYDRTTMVYERTLSVTPDMAGRRLFLYFEGVNSVADVFVNRRSAGSHKGGYTAFCIEITDRVRPGDNHIEVWAGNAFRTDVLPVSGDFNVYGGIHRPVRLIVTGCNCISPLFHASPGVLIRQDRVTADKAELTVETLLSLKGDTRGLTLRATVTDADGRTVAQAESPAAGGSVSQRMTVSRPTLWDGRHNPYMYKVEAVLMADGIPVDRVEQHTGLRSFSVDAERGFILNGKPYPLYGFNRHDDFKGRGSALTEREYRRDMELIRESGATIIRLAHYPHGERMYQLADSSGIVLWSEIPLCGPGGYMFTGYLDAVADNARQAAREMVYQKFNHPSVCFWGLFNELLKEDGRLREYDDPVPLVRELNDFYHTADPSRLTCFATCVDHKHYLGCSDLIAWNKYFDWKSSEASAAKFFDNARSTAQGTPVGVSEYGRGGSILQHADPLHYKDYRLPGTYHPEEYQAICHEGYWKAFAGRPWLWARIIWQMTDMQSCIKDEGDTPGVNDKGMVTYGRETKKDAFFFYKANWNPEPMLYLCSRRFTERDYDTTCVKAYTTLREATLYLNGKKVGKRKADALHRVVWEGVRLAKGANTIRIEGRNGKQLLTDTCTWRLK